MNLFRRCVLAVMFFLSPIENVHAACDSVEARKNRDEGRCAVAKCLSDEFYPSECKRVSKYENVSCPRSGSSTISSDDSNCCCKKNCYLEWPNGTKCVPNGSCSNFECCANNGNPIMESFPEQCRDPISGKTFTKSYPDKDTGCCSSSSCIHNFSSSLSFFAFAVFATCFF